MSRYDAYNSECSVFTFKEGLLSRLAHDLKLQAERFSIELDDEARTIVGMFDPSSLQVVCARVDGRDEPSALSESDKAKIHENLVKDVLHTRKHPDIRFESTAVMSRGEGFSVEGQLQLHGQSRAIRAEVLPEGDRWVTEVTLHQPDFGIKPYTAALGALRVKPDVQVRLSVPREA
jgi:polyisoprenoid-binding protein YceI